MKVRRWLQFNLRSFFLFIVLVAFLCSAYVDLPYATFTQTGNKIRVSTLFPVNSVLFDADFRLVEKDRVSEIHRWWAEPKGNPTWTAWSEFAISYLLSSMGAWPA